MKIAFSARGLSVPSGGVHQFIKSMIPALERQKGDAELFIFYNRQEFLGLAPGCSEILIQGDNRLWWDFVLLPKALRKLKIDAAIFPKNIVPLLTGCASYAVIHDLAYFDRQLNAYPFLDTMYMRSFVPQSVRRAEGIFAVSESTKNDIIHYTKCDPKKITVTYEAADRIYCPIDDSARREGIKRKYDLPENFIMYTGSLSPRKNLKTLLRAFGRVSGKVPHDLVLTGSKSWKDAPVYRAMCDLGLTDKIRQLGYVEHEDMPGLYNMAAAYVYPSLYEGFGLPVLEAMQCGCPVVASNATSIPEVAGDAAVLVDPLDIPALADGIYRVLTDNKLREELVCAGFRQARKFSWDRCADTMLKIIRQSTAEV